MRGLIRRNNLDYSDYHIVTSGCSFSDVHNYNWQHFLRDKLGCNVYSYGHTGAGNDYISDSLIYGISKLLDSNIPPDKIKVLVMWSGPSRNQFFLSEDESRYYHYVIDPLPIVPVNRSFVNYTEMTELHGAGNYSHDDDRELKSGWLFAGPNGEYSRDANLVSYKKFCNMFFQNYYTFEEQILKSLNNFLKVQWFCESKNLFLLNMTYKNIFDFDVTNNMKHLLKLIDFDKWWFWKERGGLYEYTLDNELPFRGPEDDHPLMDSHGIFTDTILINELNKRNAWL